MNLQNLNVAELSAQEVRETEGGWVGIVLAIGLYVLAEWDDISAGWNDHAAGLDPNYQKCN